MKSKPDKAGEDEIIQGGRGPGELLQAARMKIGLSIEDVAQRMHLSYDIVEAIEENNFSEITAPIFVKGYLRVYARIVSLDEDEMIQQYAEFYSNEDPPISSIGNVIPEISPSDRRVKLVTYLVIVVLVVLLAIWGWKKYQTRPDVVSLDAQSTSETQVAEIAEQPVNTDIVVVSEASGENQQERNASADLQGPSTNQNEVLVEVATNASIQTADEPEPVNLENPGLLPDEEEQNLEPEAPTMVEVGKLQEPEVPVLDEEQQLQKTEDRESAVSAELIARESPVGSDQLKIVVNADSWVEISDASGHRLLYTLIRANQEFSLTGKAPFSVFFGNGYGVEITFNGEEVDVLSLVKSNNTVNLEIGG
jgi:cytoskeleton protein RodZ